MQQGFNPLQDWSTLNTQVLYSKFGFMYQDVKMGSDDYILIREDDVIGVMPRSSEAPRMELPMH